MDSATKLSHCTIIRMPRNVENGREWRGRDTKRERFLMGTLYRKVSALSFSVLCLILMGPVIPLATGQAVDLGTIATLSAEDLIERPGNYFDLEGTTLRFSPTGDHYQVENLPLDFDEDFGAQLAWEAASGNFAGWLVPLDFSFPFGNQMWTELYVNTFGNITFGQSESEAWPDRSPWSDGGMVSIASALDSRAAAGSERMIAVLWASYSFWSVETNAVYAKATSQDLTVTWELERDGQSRLVAGVNIFQARLSSTGTIEFSYKDVAEKDGIVGIFSGTAVPGSTLDSIVDPPINDDVQPVVRVKTVDVVDYGSTIRFTISPGAPIPTTVSTGTLQYQIRFEFGETDCLLYVSFSETNRRGTSCSLSPGAIGFRIREQSVDLFLSKILLKADQFSWSADAVWWDSPLPGNNSSGTDSRSLTVTEQRLDLSTTFGTLGANIFEVFHYPIVTKDSRQLLPVIYGQFEPDEDIAVIVMDFLVDELYAGGGGTGAQNVPIKGIGAFAENPGDGARLGSNRLQMSMAPIYLDGPYLAETRLIGASQYSGFPDGLSFVAHEGVHRWGIGLSFRNPETGLVESLVDEWCSCHWSESLNAPAFFPVGSAYSEDPLLEESIMGGSAWQDNGDGTFSKLPGNPTVRGLSALDLYLMGLLAPEEVPDTFILRDLVRLEGDRYSATKVPVRIEDIIAAHGPRIPSHETSQKKFVLGVYMLHEPGRPPDPDLLARAQAFSEAIPRYFDLATDGRMRVTHDPTNEAPTANDLSVTTRENEPVAVQLKASDPEGTVLTFSIVNEPNNGTLTGELPAVVYEPNEGFIGTDYLTFSADDDELSSNIATVSIAVESGEQPSPLHNIKANGSDEPVIITTNDTLSVTLSLDAGNGVGQSADWWLAEATPAGWAYYDLTAGWVPGLNVTYQGPLVDLGSMEVFNMSGLPAGAHTFYFGADLTMDGEVNDPIYYDSVVVNVLPPE